MQPTETNNTFGAITFVIAGFKSSVMFAILGICTKFKYHNNPIHIMPAKTCKYLKPTKKIPIKVKTITPKIQSEEKKNSYEK